MSPVSRSRSAAVADTGDPRKAEFVTTAVHVIPKEELALLFKAAEAMERSAEPISPGEAFAQSLSEFNPLASPPGTPPPPRAPLESQLDPDEQTAVMRLPSLPDAQALPHVRLPGSSGDRVEARVPPPRWRQLAPWAAAVAAIILMDGLALAATAKSKRFDRVLAAAAAYVHPGFTLSASLSRR